MKTFFRFWFLLGPSSQAVALYVYASDLETATAKANERLKKNYHGASLINRMEVFELADANRFTRASVPLSQCLSPADLTEACEDIEKLPADALDSPTRRIARDFEIQRESISLRENQPLLMKR